MNEHYQRTGLYLPQRMGGELIRVSRAYLESCLPSKKELILLTLRAVCCVYGVLTLCTLTLPMAFAWWRLVTAMASVMIGVLCWARYERLKRNREGFRKCAEAKTVRTTCES